MPDQHSTEPSSPERSSPEPSQSERSRGLSRRTLFAGVAGLAGAAVFADPAGIVDGATGGAAGQSPAAEAAGTPVEPRHGAGEWTEDPVQDGLSQSPTTIVTGDIAAAPLDGGL